MPFAKKENPEKVKQPEKENDTNSRFLKSDMYDVKNCYVILVDLPGVAKKEIKLKWEENRLKLRVVFDEFQVEEDTEIFPIFEERCHDECVRYYDFKNPIDKSSIRACLIEGLLKITVRILSDEEAEEQELIEIE
jgi:HSP20 family protein